jgi:hypothetical protein
MRAMGTLRTPTGTLVPLLADTLIGRSDRTDVRVDDRVVSSEHARIRWTGRAWVVRDLGAKNGTWVDGRRLEPGGSAALGEGSAVGLGSDAPRFHLASASPPVVAAVDDAGAVRLGTGQLLALPDDDHPELVIVGEAGVWRAETADGERAVVDGEVVEALGRRFRLRLPEPVDGTWERDAAVGLSLADAILHFRVSRDEEHVELDVEVGQKRHALGSRAHHYLLLVLARLRAEDADPHGESARGWIGQEELTRMLGAREGALHTSVFRARAELSELGLADAAGVVERRKGSRQLRLGVGRFTVTPI